MARKLNSFFETPGTTAHVAYLFVLILLCAVPLVVLPFAAHVLPLSRHVLVAAFACPLVLVGLAVIVYGPVRYRIRRLLRGCDDKAVLRSPCLIVTGAIEQPGVAEILAGKLILVPLFGRTIEVPLEHIECVTPSHWFSGASFESLTGFMVACPESNRRTLGFAVPDGDAWRSVLPHVTCH